MSWPLFTWHSGVSLVLFFCFLCFYFHSKSYRRFLDCVISLSKLYRLINPWSKKELRSETNRIKYCTLWKDRTIITKFAFWIFWYIYHTNGGPVLLPNRYLRAWSVQIWIAHWTGNLSRIAKKRVESDLVIWTRSGRVNRQPGYRRGDT